LVLLGAATFGKTLLSRPTPGAPPTLAIVPFANGSGDTAQQYVADGFTVGLNTNLAMMGGLRLSAPGSVDAALRSSTSPLAAAQRLGADRLVEGSVDARRSSVRVEVRLLDARSKRVLLKRDYTGTMSGLQDVQNAVALDLAAALGITISPALQARLTRPLTQSRRAFELYTRGVVAVNRWNRQSLDAAIAALESAVTADSTFALARTALANAYLEKADLFDPRGEWADKARLEVEVALLLSPDLAEAHLAKGNLLWTSANGFPHAAAFGEFQRAADLSPSLSAARDRLALVYLHTGRLDDALREAREAVTLDPLNFWARFRVGMVLVYRGQFREGAEWLQRLPEDVAPAFRGAFLAEALLQLGRPSESARVLDNLGPRVVRDPLVRARRAVEFANAGDRSRAQAEIAAATALAPGFAHGHHAEYAIGQAYTLLGADSLALNWLEHAASDGLPCYPRYAGDPVLRRLRGTPRFDALLRSLQDESERYGREFAVRRGREGRQ
jgi:TolB-like protein/Flp pilus assembly protein TadD